MSEARLLQGRLGERFDPITLTDEEADAQELALAEYEDRRGPSAFFLAGRAALIAAAAGWIGFLGYLVYRRGFVMPTLDQLPSAASNAAIPLLLVGIGYLILIRGSRGEADRFARIAATLRRESEALDMRLAIVNQQLDTARLTMHEQASLLEHYGASASVNLEAAARTIAEHADTFAQKSEAIERAGTALNDRFGGIIDAMPQFEDRIARMTDTLTDGGRAIGDRVDNLEGRLASLSRMAEEARANTLSATQSLTAQLMQIQDATRSATEEVNGIADISANRMSLAIFQSKQAWDEAGKALETQREALAALIEQSQAAIAGLSTGAVERFSGTAGDVEARLSELDRLITGQAQLVAGIGEELDRHVAQLGERFRAFEQEGVASSERLAASLDTVRERARGVDAALATGGETVASLVARSEALLTALDASVRELDETHPNALMRLDERIERSREALDAIMPEIGRLETAAASVLDQAHRANALLDNRSRDLAEWLTEGERALASNREQLSGLAEQIASTDADVRRLNDSSGPQLIATLLRVKETANQAAERARQALAKAIGEAIEELGDASEAALRERLGEQFNERIGEISDVADRAVKAAHAASDRLMRQLLTIADTTASIEQRISEAEQAAEARDRESLSQRAAILIDALNSAAIDVAKIMSADVGDTSWAAYLKGDRGVFTRRAVRLIDTEEARSLAGLYGSDAGFRESANRYIHDFEAMLRNVLAMRDGSALGVTLLSSDIGKLYVALAQATDRLAVD